MPVPPDWDLKGKAALVTTGGHSATPFLAAALAEAGAQVAVAGGPAEALEAVRRATEPFSSETVLIPVDVDDPAGVRRAVAQALDAHGRLDALVNNCQVMAAKPFLETTPQEFDQMLDQNLRSVFLFCQAAGEHMLDQGWGRIVNVSSMMADRGVANMAPYCASMGGVVQLTKALGLEWSRRGVRVNGIGPGWFIGEEQDLEEQQKELLVRFLPSRRYGHPRDLAGLLIYLCSEACDLVTGHTIFVDGGAMARL
ncbi:MAG: SDR family oxidoreductase [Dehalococcoidia bacterium]|jgi:NAD(P)-dependent dehydrogenase (short-subunit alcohol dehydrogenase family)|nr:SDR family oxidoreductase [Dehalococcoidia bacterium]